MLELRMLAKSHGLSMGYIDISTGKLGGKNKREKTAADKHQE